MLTIGNILTITINLLIIVYVIANGRAIFDYYYISLPSLSATATEDGAFGTQMYRPTKFLVKLSFETGQTTILNVLVKFVI